MIKFYCPSCNQKLGVPDEYAGKRIRCGKCSQPAVVPKPADKPAPQPIQTHSNKPQPKNDSNLQIEEDPNAAILRQARQEQIARQKTKSAPSRAKADNAGRSPFFSLTDVTPDFLHFPLALVSAIVFIIAAIILWMILHATTGLAYGIEFFFIIVALAGPIGLCLFTEHRGASKGILAVFIGLFGIILARITYAGLFVIPEWKKDIVMAKEIPSDMTNFYSAMGKLSGMGGRNYFQEMPEDKSVMTAVAICSLIMQDKIEPLQGQTLYLSIRKDESKLTDPNTIELKTPNPDLDKPLQLVKQQLGQWSKSKRPAMLRSYYERYLFFEHQCRFKTLLDDRPKAIAAAFFQCDGCIFLLLRVIYCTIGLFGAYKTCSESYMD